MKAIKMFGLAVVALVSTTALADFSFNAGYAWREQAKTEFKGVTSKITPHGGAYTNGSFDSTTGAWSGGSFGSIENETVPTENDYTLILNRADSVASGSDEDSAHGLTTSIGYDFYDNEVIALGATLRFAGYWGINNSRPGGYMVYNDTYRFPSHLVDIDPQPSYAEGDALNANDFVGRDYLAGGPGGRVTLKSDLYQIGLGPKVTWHALSFLDVYGGVEALCCFVNSDLDAGGASTSEVNNLWGVGGHLGLAGYITENVGFFGQVGYEWIDEDDVSVKGIHAKTDYSSLVLSAGLQFSF